MKAKGQRLKFLLPLILLCGCQGTAPVYSPLPPTGAEVQGSKFKVQSSSVIAAPGGVFPFIYPVDVSTCSTWAMYSSTDLVHWQQMPFYPDSLDSNGIWIVHVDPTQPGVFFNPQVTFNP